MNVLGHDDVARYVEFVPLTYLLESLFEDAAGFWGAQERCAVVAAEGYEMKAAGFLESL